MRHRTWVYWIVKGTAGAVVSLAVEATRAGIAWVDLTLGSNSGHREATILAARDIENRFLGSLLGLAIGDALGMPVGETSVVDMRQRYGEITGYLSRDPGTDREIPAGEITDETETTLCIVESMTTNNGQVDVENINARLLHLAEGASQHWMPVDLRDGIIAASDNDGVVREDFKRPASLAAGIMGVPIGLMHSIGGFDRNAFDHDLRLIARLTNASDEQYRLTAQIASLIAETIRAEPLAPRGAAVDADETLERDVSAIARDVAAATAFEDVVFEAVNTHRPADSAGALAGALAGVRFGASGIPQKLIDELEARVYLTLAAPWFYKTATRRAGLVIDLRQT